VTGGVDKLIAQARAAVIAPSALRALAQQAKDLREKWEAEPDPNRVGYWSLLREADLADAAFIAACDPQTILALLDAVEAALKVETWGCDTDASTSCLAAVHRDQIRMDMTLCQSCEARS
jgi:hypothetical protein